MYLLWSQWRPLRHDQHWDHDCYLRGSLFLHYAVDEVALDLSASDLLGPRHLVILFCPGRTALVRMVIVYNRRGANQLYLRLFIPPSSRHCIHPAALSHWFYIAPMCHSGLLYAHSETRLPAPKNDGCGGIWTTRRRRCTEVTAEFQRNQP